MYARIAGAAALLATTAGASTAAPREFTVRSADGTEITGQVDGPVTQAPRVAVVMVSGTGVYDRDMNFGPGGERSLVFKDLAERFAARGLAVVRTDNRGVSHGKTRPDETSLALLATRSTSTMREDLAAAYAWALSPSGLAARCVVLFAHSEGMHHVGRLAAAGAPAPLAVVGMGPSMESPAAVLRWQVIDRVADSLERMDADGDGRITDPEVQGGWTRTPAGAGRLESLLHPSGAWSADDLKLLRNYNALLYGQQRAAAIKKSDAEPYPTATLPMASYEWWKSWYLDETPTGRHLARWRVPVSLHYGSIDSQTDSTRGLAAARAELPRALLKTQVHPDRGHTLGEHATYGPMDEAIADELADEVTRLSNACT